MLYTYINFIINRHAGTPNKAKTKGTMSLEGSSICNTGSRVPMMEIYQVMGVERYILTSRNYGLEIK